MNNRFQSWGDVRVFLAVLDEGSTLGAARALGMAQPTVARRIDALEHALALTLFERDTRGFHPTPAACALAEEARRVAEAAADLQRKADALRPAEMRIRLTAPKPNFSENLAAALADFSDMHPGTQFEFVARNEMLDLMAGEADVAIRFSNDIADERLVCRRLTLATASLYAGQTYAARHGLPASETEFAGHRFIVFDRPRQAMPVHEWLMARIAPEQIVSRVSDPEAMVAAVRAGLGLGMLPTTLAEEAGALLRCFAPPPGCEVQGWLVISPEAWRRPVVKAFARFFVPRFRAYIRGGG